jgi:hypothetical protein
MVAEGDVVLGPQESESRDGHNEDRSRAHGGEHGRAATHDLVEQADPTHTIIYALIQDREGATKQRVVPLPGAELKELPGGKARRRGLRAKAQDPGVRRDAGVLAERSQDLGRGLDGNRTHRGTSLGRDSTVSATLLD